MNQTETQGQEHWTSGYRGQGERGEGRRDDKCRLSGK